MTLLSSTATGILAGHVKWLTYDINDTAMLVCDMSSNELASALHKCRHDQFTNNGLNTTEWVSIIEFEMKRRRDVNKNKINTLFESLMEDREVIKQRLEQHLEIIDNAVATAMELDLSASHLMDCKFKALTALANFR
jgi:transcriptional regulator NrdR family protein